MHLQLPLNFFHLKQPLALQLFSYKLISQVLYFFIREGSFGFYFLTKLFHEYFDFIKIAHIFILYEKFF
jgi:hypothetical protein